jgi:hypothetical protein
MANLTDEVSRLTRIMWMMHVADRRAMVLRERAFAMRPEGAGLLAKAAGVSVDTLKAFESGHAEPTPAQCSAWLLALYGAQPRSLVDGTRIADPDGAFAEHPQPAAPAPDPVRVLAAAGGRKDTFAPDLDRLDRLDAARFASELAARVGVNPLMPGRLLDPCIAFFAVLDVQAAGDGPVKITHALTTEQRTWVHAALHAAWTRVRGDRSDPAEPVAARLAAEWDKHIRWKEADPSVRRWTAGPEDADPAATRIGGWDGPG